MWETMKVAALLALDNIVASLMVAVTGAIVIAVCLWMGFRFCSFLRGRLAFLHCTAFEIIVGKYRDEGRVEPNQVKAKGRKQMAKYVFVTGGVVSGLGKGITAASLGRLLKSRGIDVTIAKLDPYINVDPGTMSPLQHGEVFVTEDGAETDLDLGHYERFMDVNLTKMSNVTTGKIYWSIITKERRGEFLGGTVQVIPHVTNEIKDHISGSPRDRGGGGHHRDRRHRGGH